MRSGSPRPEPGAPGEAARFVGWLGSLGCVAAGYAVFQFLFTVLPSSLGGEAARYLISGVSGLGTAAAAWLAAALLRARAGTDAVPVIVAPTAVPPGPLPQIFAAAYDTLVGQVSVVDDPDRGRLTGWSHSLGESVPSRPTSVGTAYGLHIMLDLGEPDGRLSTGDLVDTLWRLRLRLRLPDGGWSARSQGAMARPEVTALVLGALARAGVSTERLAEEVERCTVAFTLQLDRPGRESTHVLTTVMRGLLRAAPRSDALPLLREALIDGAISDPRRRRLRCWSRRLDPPHGPLPLRGPSPLHTAQSVVALDRTARVLGDTRAAREAREDGVRWLLACPDAPHTTCPDLVNLREEVRRPRPDDPSHHEVLGIRHHTAAWIVRALLTPGAREVAREDGLEREWRERLDGAAAAVRAGQTGGIWTWAGPDGGDLHQPLWMTYQGLSALRAHAVWMYLPGG